MMKLVVLSCFLAAALATTFHGTGELTTFTATTVTVTAGLPAGSTAPVLLTLTYPTTYDSSGSTCAAFVVTGTATVVGNNTISSGVLSLTNGGDTQQVAFFGGLVTGTTQVLSGGGCPVFKNTASYSASVNLKSLYDINSYNNVNLMTGTLAAVAATKYTPPTLSLYTLPSPQTGGCGASSCTNPIQGNATVGGAGANMIIDTILRPSTAATGVRFETFASVPSGGGVFFNSDTVTNIAATFGSVVGGVWSSGTVVPSSSVVVPQNAALTISSQISQGTFSTKDTYFPESSFTGALQSSVTLSSGGTDVTAPTCTVASITPATINTYTSSVAATVTATCADESGGSGLAQRGVFLSATVNGVSQTINVGTVAGTGTFNVPPYVSGTVSIIGVWAVDNAGNTAVYGSCGSAGYDSMGCGGGGSSASTVTISLFAMVVLAIFALFA